MAVSFLEYPCIPRRHPKSYLLGVLLGMGIARRLGMGYPFPMSQTVPIQGLPATEAGLWLNIPTMPGSTGNLSFLHAGKDTPFPIQRIYYMYGVTGPRGGHAHIEQQQVFIAIHGSFKLRLTDGRHDYTVLMDNPARAVQAGKMVWRDVTDFSPGAVCLVLASTPYAEADYIRNYKDFLQRAKK